MTYKTITDGTQVPVKAWVNGVPFEDAARQQLVNAAAASESSGFLPPVR